MPFRFRFVPFVTACALACAMTPLRARAETLHVATTPIDVGAQVYYAQDMGFFKKAGLDVDIQTVSNGSAIAAAVASNATDIGQGNVLSIVAAVRKHLPFVIVAPAGVYNSIRPTSQLVVAPHSPIRSAADLAGKTIAINGLRNILELGATAWLAQNKVDPKSVHFVEIPFSNMQEAVTTGRVDAAFVAEPTLTNIKGGVRVIASPYSSIAPSFLIGSWFTTHDWAAQHAETARRFAAAMHETAIWANSHPAQSAAILAKYTKLPLGTLRAMARSAYGDRNEASLVQPVIDDAAKFGFIDDAFPATDLFAK